LLRAPDCVMDFGARVPMPPSHPIPACRWKMLMQLPPVVVQAQPTPPRGLHGAQPITGFDLMQQLCCSSGFLLLQLL